MENKLVRKLRARLSAADLALLNRPPRPYEPDDLAWDFERILYRAKTLEQEVVRNRRLIADKHGNLVMAPRGRQLIVLKSSPPAMLVALAYDLIQRSSDKRFESVRESLELARLGLEAAEIIDRRELLSKESSNDLLAEAWTHLGNSRRINGDLPGAEEALDRVDALLGEGTGDRSLRADYFWLLGSLRFSQGEAEEAARIYDAQIQLRRLIGDRRGLGKALIDRGVVGAWFEPLSKASAFLAEGLHLVEDTRLMLLALFAVAERQARDGKGLEAFRSLVTADSAVTIARDRSFELMHRWISGITHRVLGRLDQAEEDLTAVRLAYLRDDVAFRAAFVSLDLAAVYVAQGRRSDAFELLESVYTVFVAERLERRALAAFQALYRAAQTERLTESLAVEVTNFIVRFQHNRKLQFRAAEE